MFAAVLEKQVGPIEQVARGPRHEDLSRTGEGRHPRRSVDRNAARVPARQVDLAGVETSTDLDTKRPDRVGHGGGAADGPGRTVEERQKSVSGRHDLAATEPVELAPQRVVVIQEHPPPRLSPSRASVAVEFDDVGEQDRRQRRSSSSSGAIPNRRALANSTASNTVSPTTHASWPGGIS